MGCFGKADLGWHVHSPSSIVHAWIRADCRPRDYSLQTSGWGDRLLRERASDRGIERSTEEGDRAIERPGDRATERPNLMASAAQRFEIGEVTGGR